MNVAMVTSWKVRCGISSYSENLIMALSKLGVNVYVIRLPRFGVKTPDILQSVVEKVPLDKIDLIHVQHEYGLYQNLEGGFFGSLKRLGKPIVTTMHSAGAWEIDRVVEDASDRVVVHNEFCRRRFCSTIKSEKTVIIPHGASPLKEPPPPKEECKRSLGLQEKAPIVGYLGFISNYKGLESLIEAMTEVKAGLLIGGGWHVEAETAYTVSLKELTLQVLPGRCRWLGYVSNSDLSRVYGAMDLLVYPSRFATESGALISALAHGKAVIASNIAPFREKKKEGALITFRSIPDLTGKIRKLLKDECLRTKLEEGAEQFAKRRSWDNVAQRHFRLYRELLK